MQLKSEVLPAPFGPIRPQICPRATSKLHAVQRHDPAEPDRDAIDRKQRRGAALREADDLLGPGVIIPDVMFFVGVTFDVFRAFVTAHFARSTNASPETDVTNVS